MDSFEILDFSAIEGRAITATAPPASESYAKRSGVDLSWPQVDAAAEYRIYRSSPGHPRELVLTTRGKGSNQAFDAGLELGSTYTYQVAAVSSAGTESRPSQGLVYQQPSLQPRAAAVSTCPPPTVLVSTTEGANAAIAAANPGDTIRLADGTYGPLLVSQKHGTAANRISICGTRDAVVSPYPDTINMQSYMGVAVSGSSFITLNGFTVRNARKGVELIATDDSRVYGLRVQNTAQGGIYAQEGSSRNLIAANVISDTGSDSTIPIDKNPWWGDGRYGEGIYVGNSQGNDSCETAGCDLDQSDGNVIVWNTITNVTAEAIEAKEGSTGGLIYNNSVTFSAQHEKSIEGALKVKGDEYLVQRNNVTSGLRYGIFTTTTKIGDRDWGYRNVFTNNAITLTGAIEPPELGFFEWKHQNVLGCDNTLISSRSVPLYPATTVCDK